MLDAVEPRRHREVPPTLSTVLVPGVGKMLKCKLKSFLSPAASGRLCASWGWEDEGWAPFAVSSVLPQAGVWLRLWKVSTLLSLMLTMSHISKSRGFFKNENFLVLMTKARACLYRENSNKKQRHPEFPYLREITIHTYWGISFPRFTYGRIMIQVITHQGCWYCAGIRLCGLHPSGHVICTSLPGIPLCPSMRHTQVGTPEPDCPDAEAALPPTSCVTSSKLVSTLPPGPPCRTRAIMVAIGGAVQRIRWVNTWSTPTRYCLLPARAQQPLFRDMGTCSEQSGTWWRFHKDQVTKSSTQLKSLLSLGF